MTLTFKQGSELDLSTDSEGYELRSYLYIMSHCQRAYMSLTSNILTKCTDKTFESKLYLELVHPIIKYLAISVYDLHLLIKWILQ